MFRGFYTIKWLGIKQNTNEDRPKVMNAIMNCMIPHFQSLLNRAGKKLKKNVVQENPIGACLGPLCEGWLSVISVHAIINAL